MFQEQRGCFVNGYMDALFCVSWYTFFLVSEAVLEGEGISGGGL